MKNKYVFTAALLGLLTVFSIVLVHVYDRTAVNSDKKLVVASFYPVYIAALNVVDGVDDVELACLTQPTSGCAHDHQLTTEDMKRLEKAQLFLINGAGMESYLEDVMKRYPDLEVADSSKGIDLLESSDHDHDHDHDSHTQKQEDEHEEDTHKQEETDAEHTHNHEEDSDEIYNSHVWMDMQAYCIQVEHIANALAEMDPENADIYQKNAGKYQDKINKLLQEAQSMDTGKNPQSVSTHEAFSYFARNITWTIPATINMDENTTLKASQVSEVIDAVKTGSIPYVFTEKIYGTSLGNILHKEADSQIVILDTLVSGKMDKDAYLDGMKKNLKVLEEAVHDE